MGLDMYAYSTQQEINEVDFNFPTDLQKLMGWRKHPNLHGWMEELYIRKGGTGIFNVDCVRLDAEDIDALEIAVFEDTLPVTDGFFFGESRSEHKRDDLIFIEYARKAFNEGRHVFYTSWW